MSGITPKNMKNILQSFGEYLNITYRLKMDSKLKDKNTSWEEVVELFMNEKEISKENTLQTFGEYLNITYMLNMDSKLENKNTCWEDVVQTFMKVMKEMFKKEKIEGELKVLQSLDKIKLPNDYDDWRNDPVLVHLDRMTMASLKATAKEMKLKGYQTIKDKEELIDRIKENL